MDQNYEIHAMKQEIENQINYKKVIEISGGNKAFIRRYKELATRIFQELPRDYEQGLVNQDQEALRKICHNMRATIGLLDLHGLDSEMVKVRNLLRDNRLDRLEIENSIKKVYFLCEIYITSLDRMV